MVRILIIVVLIVFQSCTKDKFEVNAVLVREGCEPGSWIVQINNPNLSKHDFLCPNSVAMTSPFLDNCGNSAVILNIPQSMARAGNQISFSEWTDEGQPCFNDPTEPHHLMVSDLQD